MNGFERMQNSENINPLYKAISIAQRFHEKYYGSSELIVVPEPSNKVGYVLWSLIQESIKLGLIDGKRFGKGVNDISEYGEAFQFKRIPINYLPDSSIQNLEQVLNIIGQKPASIFIGGSREISKNSQDKTTMESNVLKSVNTLLDSGGVLINGGVGQDRSIMRLAVESYLQNKGEKYIAILRQAYAKYELPELKRLQNIYSNDQVNYVIVETGDQGTSLMDTIIQNSASVNCNVVVSGAGLGTIDELLKLFVLKQKSNNPIQILNSTQYSKALGGFLDQCGLRESSDFMLIS